MSKLIQNKIDVTNFSVGSGSNMALQGTVTDLILIENLDILFPIDFCISFSFLKYSIKHYFS